MNYMKDKIAEMSEDDLYQFYKDPSSLTGIMDEYEIRYGYDDYDLEKRDLLEKFGLIRERKSKSSEFYKNNMDILENVYSIAIGKNTIVIK